ncbi:hypothetical protein [Elizabethkingia anophelis]|uniref:hypothetical protein n=1 Tax=Elizabethkingia anophelis TaxID=1117645 RepID=UPI0032091728
MAQKQQDVETVIWMDKNRRLTITRKYFSRVKKRKVLYWITLRNKITEVDYKLPAITREDLQFIVDQIDGLEKLIDEGKVFI